MRYTKTLMYVCIMTHYLDQSYRESCNRNSVEIFLEIKCQELENQIELLFGMHNIQQPSRIHQQSSKLQ